LGSDKDYDAASFVAGRPALNVLPHIVQNTSGAQRRFALQPDDRELTFSWMPGLGQPEGPRHAGRRENHFVIY
jgi:hypothetical protein